MPADDPNPDPFAPEAPPGPAPGSAIWALVLSVLGFTCLPFVGGMMGIALGLMARGEIERSAGRKGGKGLANAGITLGIVNLGAGLVGVGVLIALVARPSAPTSTPAVSPYSGPAVPAPMPRTPTPLGPPTGKPRVQPPSLTSSMSRDDGIITLSIGNVTLVDVGILERPLTEELNRQREAAKKSGERVLLWVVELDCKPCNGVAAALREPRMQAALRGVRLVRLNAGDYRYELSKLGIPTDKIPAFALLARDNHPSDFIHGGEWDEDIATNIAPILEQFLRGTFRKRRHPWKETRREDETPL